MQDRVLLLNNDSLEIPLKAISLEKAMTRLYREKVYVHSTNGFLRYPGGEIERPSIVVLKRYVYVPYSKPPLSRRNLMLRDASTCQYCFRPGNTIDHVIPRAKGGQHTWENVVISCFKCNNKKSDKLLSQIGWDLKVKPKVPNPRDMSLYRLGQIEESWKPFFENHPIYGEMLTKVS